MFHCAFSDYSLKRIFYFPRFLSLLCCWLNNNNITGCIVYIMAESDEFTSSESEEEVVNVFDQLGNLSNPPVPKKVPLEDVTTGDIKRRRPRGS